MSELDALQERLAQLESQINRSRRLTAFSVILGALAIAGLLYQWSNPGDSKQASKLAQKLRAESFSLVDAADKVRGQWAMTDNGPGLMLADDKGVEQVRLGVIPEGPYVALQDGEGRLRVVMDATKPDGPSISVLDEQGMIRGRMVVSAAGSFLSLKDTKGKTRVGQGVTREGGGLTLLDEDGKERLRLGAPDVGRVLWLKDGDGKEVFRRP
jgi:hypothetical protein